MKFSIYNYKNSNFRAALYMLSTKDLRRVKFISIIQVSLAMLDIVSVAIFGAVGALAVTAIQSAAPGTRVAWLLDLVGLSGKTLQEQIAFLTLFSILIMVVKTFISIIYSKKMLRFLATRSAYISKTLFSRFMQSSLKVINESSIQRAAFAITAGVNNLVVGVIFSTVSVAADLVLVIVLATVLVLIDPWIGTLVLSLFILLGLLLFSKLQANAKYLGKELSRMGIEHQELIEKSILGYREIYVHDRIDFYVKNLGERRLDYGELDAKNRFMPSIGKYVIEIFLVVSSFLVSSLVFLIHDARQAVGILAAFLAASARMAPAVLRIQQNAIQIKSSLGNAVPTLEFNLILGENLPSKGEIRAFAADEHLGFVSTVEAKNVDFFYASESAFSLKNVSFRIDPGTNVAIVGPSGSGKTTLVDVLLGIHTPVNGEVLISGVEPIRAIKKWPGAISYVPQSSNVFKGSIKENVALAFAANEVSDAEIWEALKFAHLENLVLELEEQILSNVGDRGSKLSGGQKQRIGIARAYLTNPRIVFFDEATSSLDDETDFQVTSAIRNLNRKGITTISIAHRKSTIALADKILYIKNGSLVELDNFGEFEKIFPSFQLEEDSEI